jgi:subtilase family serine protease
MPQEGETTTITATIQNAGFDSASNILVRFFLGDPASGGTQIGADQIIPSLAPNSSTPVSVTASFTGTGNKSIYVVADPDNLISETSKADNKASTYIWVATAADLAIFSEDLVPSTLAPASGTAFTLAYKVYNVGESSAGAFVVSLYDGDPAQDGKFLQSSNISGITGGEVRIGTFGVTLTGDGPHTLYLTIDPGNLVPEISETNNTGVVAVNVGGIVTLSDLVMTQADITLTPSRPKAGDTIAISAKVRNIGVDVANNFTMEIFDNAPENGGTLIYSQTLSLIAGAEQTVSTNWPIPTGIHDVYVVLDRTNIVIE